MLGGRRGVSALRTRRTSARVASRSAASFDATPSGRYDDPQVPHVCVVGR